MTPDMLAKSRATADALGLTHVEFREGLAEAVPVDDGWADVVISNGVINLCADKQAVFAEILQGAPPWRAGAVRRHRQRSPRAGRGVARH
jgi:SAM-dependent methyltransferase